MNKEFATTTNGIAGGLIANCLLLGSYAFVTGHTEVAKYIFLMLTLSAAVFFTTLSKSEVGEQARNSYGSFVGKTDGQEPEQIASKPFSPK